LYPVKNYKEEEASTMKLRLATLFMLTTFLAACECGDSEEATTSGQGGSDVAGPTPGTAADFVTNVEDRVFYGFDRYDLAPESRAVLEKQAAWLLKYPERHAEVAGYCDARGTVEYNDKLGQRRADAARDYLTSLGVTASRLSTISYGKRVTLVPGSTEEVYAQNRVAITAIK
jgi:peptidoglycan-associated lipoprotein